MVVSLLSMLSQNLSKNSRKIMRWLCFYCPHTFSVYLQTIVTNSVPNCYSFYSFWSKPPHQGSANPSVSYSQNTLYFFFIESKRTVINACVIMPASPRLYKLHEGRIWSNLNKSNSVCFMQEIRMPIYMHGKFIWRQEHGLICSLFAHWSVAQRS